MTATAQSFPPPAHISRLPGLKEHWPFPRRATLRSLRVHRKIPPVTRGLPGAAQSSGLRLSLTWSAVGGRVLSPSQHSGGLVQTWHDQPSASTRPDNRNIQRFICWSLICLLRNGISSPRGECLARASAFYKVIVTEVAPQSLNPCPVRLEDLKLKTTWRFTM